MPTVKQQYPDVLGASTNITVEELLSLTNQSRSKNGLTPLRLDTRLASAAALKAQDMLRRNYWAHNGPDGTTPWTFIKEAGYVYTYAGENLARGFSSSGDIISAWLASPGHRENMLSKNYQDIGFAVVEGKLTGENTVLVVEMFGNTTPQILANQPEQSVGQGIVQYQQEQLVEGSSAPSVQMFPLLDSRWLSQNVAFVILSLFIMVFILDMIVIERKKIARVAGHNLDHILFLFAIVIIIVILRNGFIL